jgi:hypothetical protein
VNAVLQTLFLFPPLFSPSLAHSRFSFVRAKVIKEKVRCDYAENTPPELVEFCLQCMSVSPDQRPTFGMVVEQVGAILDSRGIEP